MANFDSRFCSNGGFKALNLSLENMTPSNAPEQLKPSKSSTYTLHIENGTAKIRKTDNGKIYNASLCNFNPNTNNQNFDEIVSQATNSLELTWQISKAHKNKEPQPTRTTLFSSIKHFFSNKHRVIKHFFSKKNTNDSFLLSNSNQTFSSNELKDIKPLIPSRSLENKKGNVPINRSILESIKFVAENTTENQNAWVAQKDKDPEKYKLLFDELNYINKNLEKYVPDDEIIPTRKQILKLLRQLDLETFSKTSIEKINTSLEAITENNDKKNNFDNLITALQEINNSYKHLYAHDPTTRQKIYEKLQTLHKNIPNYFSDDRANLILEACLKSTQPYLSNIDPSLNWFHGASISGGVQALLEKNESLHTNLTTSTRENYVRSIFNSLPPPCLLIRPSASSHNTTTHNYYALSLKKEPGGAIRHRLIVCKQIEEKQEKKLVYYIENPEKNLNEIEQYSSLHELLTNEGYNDYTTVLEPDQNDKIYDRESDYASGTLLTMKINLAANNIYENF